MSLVALNPAMAASGPPDSPDSPARLWVGSVDLSQDVGTAVELAAADGYHRARLLVRDGRQVLGFIEVDIRDGVVSSADIAQRSAALPAALPVQPSRHPPPTTVILCTRNRPAELRSALTSLVGLAYPAFEVVVVDNAPGMGTAREVAAGFDDDRIRVVGEPRPGLARARNTGVRAARHDILAFTDDDVVVDPLWLQGIADGFTDDPRVACVCGMVPSGELRTRAQLYFDARVTWARNCGRKTYDINRPPADDALFPFRVGQFGTGANFAMRRECMFDLGGFDEGLGAGSRTRGGEDIDMFVRVLLAGYELVYQPSAIVWHRHRGDMAALGEQITGYGLGLGAWMTKLLCTRETSPMVLRRALAAARYAPRMTAVTVPGELDEPGHLPRINLQAVELMAVARGPFSYAAARLAGGRKRPLAGSSRSHLT